MPEVSDLTTSIPAIRKQETTSTQCFSSASLIPSVLDAVEVLQYISLGHEAKL